MDLKTTTYTNTNVKESDFYDVVIIGGGTAGSVAAISAAREGLKTLVVEQLGSLGGTQSIGMVCPVMPSLVPDDKGQCSIHKEIVEILQQQGHGTPSTRNDGEWFDPVYLSFVLEKLALDSGVEILFHTTLIDCDVVDSEIKSIIVHNKDGLCKILAKSFIDTSGDAELAYISGIEFFSGSENGIYQNASLRFEMANIDLDKVKQYLKDCGQPFYNTTPGLGTDGRKAKKFRDLLKEKCKEGELTKNDISHFQFFSIPGKPGFLSFNCPELKVDRNIMDAKYITEKQIAGKQAINRIAKFCVKYIPGFENAVISHFSPVIGIRESRRIKAKYELTVFDVMKYRKFEDGICQSNYPLDVHGINCTKEKYIDCPKNEKYYEIPFRSMITDEISNIVVAGRCIGTDFYAQSTARVQHSCRAMGEAAGIATKIAKERNINLNQVDGTLIRKAMMLRGADFNKS